jgi:hypothetical protein
MRIEIREKGSEAFYRETVNVVSQYRALLAKPERKLRDNFRILLVDTVVCAVLLALLAAMAAAWGADGLTYAAVAVMAITGIFCVVFLVNMKRMLRNMMESGGRSVVTLDESGVELEKEGAQTVRLAWNGVAFVRVFRESVCFFARDGMGFVISVDRRYERELLDWLAAAGTGVRLIR